MRLRCPICMAPVQFDHRQLLDRAGFIECGCCHAKYQISIDDVFTDIELNDIELVDEALRVFDGDGVNIERIIGSRSQTHRTISAEHALVALPVYQTKKFWFVIMGLFFLVTVAAGGFFAYRLMAQREEKLLQKIEQKQPGFATTSPVAVNAPVAQPLPGTVPPGSQPKILAQPTSPQQVGGAAGVAPTPVEPSPTPTPTQAPPTEKSPSPTEKTVAAPAKQEPTKQEAQPSSDDDDSHSEKTKKGRPSKKDRPKKSAPTPSVNFASMSVSELVSAGDEKKRTGDRSTAIKMYEAALNKDRNSVEANMALGKTYLGMGKSSLAIERFRTVVRNGGGPGGEGYILAARCESALGHSVNAKDFYAGYLKRFSGGKYAVEAKKFVDNN